MLNTRCGIMSCMYSSFLVMSWSKIYAPSSPKAYDLIIRYHAALVSVKVYMMLKPEELHF